MKTHSDLTGQKFGRLTVMGEAPKYVSPSGNTAIRWFCRCDCGNESLVCGRDLVRKNIQSCGCLRREATVSANTKHGETSLGNGQFVACYVKKAQPDYKGTLKGGRSVVFEAKFTSADHMEQSRVLDTQASYMNQQTALGARCYVVAGFGTGGVYRLPWEVWRDMKDHFGRKYITEADLDEYKVSENWNNVLLLL